LPATTSNAGLHYPGVLIALSSRFSRRPSGINTLVAAIGAIAAEQIDGRVVYLSTLVKAERARRSGATMSVAARSSGPSG